MQDNEPSVRECSLAGLAKVRSLFERALTAAGLHISEGNKIWEAFREFEQAIHYNIDESDTAVSVLCPSLDLALVILLMFSRSGH